jgi:2-isopropylmalate synthase
MNTKRQIGRIPPEVDNVRWWKETRRRNFAKVREYADGFGRALAEPDRAHMQRVRLFDTTARDGMQMSRAFVPSQTSPETIMRNKLRIIGMLAKMGVPIIEAGFAAASEDEQNIIRTAREDIARAGLDTRIVALGRTVNEDIDAIERSEADIAHIFSSGSAPHTYVKFGKMPRDIVPDVGSSVRYACTKGFSEIIVSLEDAVRADPEFVADVGRRIRDIAGDRVRYNIPDTVGVADPIYMFALIQFLKAEVGIPLQVHCHGDRGLAEMNSIAAAVAGAEDIHVTMHGMGERAGNAALEEVAGFMMTQYGIDMVDMTMLPEVSQMVESRTGIPKKINAPYVGKLAFWHESGVHGSAVAKGDAIGLNRRNGIDGGSIYAAFDPKVVGRKEEVGVGPLSGASNVTYKMADFGVRVTKSTATAIIAAVKKRSETMPVSDADLALIAYEQISGSRYSGVDIKNCKISTCMNNGSNAKVESTVDGEQRNGAGSGNGPIDAAINAVRSAIDRDDVRITNYDSTSIGSGSDAADVCTITVNIGDESITSTEISTNTVMNAVRAFEKGVNAIDAISEMRGMAAEEAV